MMSPRDNAFDDYVRMIMFAKTEDEVNNTLDKSLDDKNLTYMEYMRLWRLGMMKLNLIGFE